MPGTEMHSTSERDHATASATSWRTKLWARLHTPQGRASMKYAVSLVTVGLGTALRLVLDPMLGEHHPFTIYFAAVAISAWYGGFAPAMVALALSYFAADWFFVTPRFEINWPHANLDEFMALMAFLFSGLAIAWTSKIMRDALESARQKQRELQQEILERQRAQQQLQKAQAQLAEHAELLEQRVEERTAHLQETIRSLEGVCYHIAHDLRAPLRAIGGYVTVMQTENGPRMDPASNDYLKRISEAAARMDLLIYGLLEYGRLGHSEFALASVNTGTVAKRVLKRFEDQINSQAATVQIQEPWPEVWANKDLLEIILSNFLNNALKFVAPGKNPVVRVWAEESAGQVRIVVEDEGIGIPRQYLHRAFAIFERLHPNEGYPGTGIGLAIATKAAERMGGRLGVESTVNQGSRFWLELRSARSPSANPPASAAQSEPRAALSVL